MRILFLFLSFIVVYPLYACFALANDDVAGNTSVQTVSQGIVSVETESVQTVTETQTSSFGQSVKNGFVATGRGIKKGTLWVWRGISKGAYYMKEGTISVLEKVGLKAKSANEVDSHEVVIREANKALVESRTKREIRREKFERIN